MPKFAELCLATRRYERVALVTDVRAIEDFNELFMALGVMRDMGCDHRICSWRPASRRLSSGTRRRAGGTRWIRTAANLKAVRREIEILAPVREQADIIIDTTDLTLGRLQRRLFAILSKNTNEKPMSVNIISFG